MISKLLVFKYLLTPRTDNEQELVTMKEVCTSRPIQSLLCHSTFQTITEYETQVHNERRSPTNRDSAFFVEFSR
jgi:hypothetical protein